jgi:hypothetical protein
MFLDDIPINYLAVLLAAIAYFVIGWIWYAPFLFGNQWGRHEEKLEEPGHYSRKIGAYVGEFIIALVIAYVLALFIEISQADEMVEGIVVALWVWVGFIVTTHFSAILWGRKTVKHFFIHVGFMLLGLIAMGAVIMSFYK